MQEQTTTTAPPAATPLAAWLTRLGQLQAEAAAAINRLVAHARDSQLPQNKADADALLRLRGEWGLLDQECRRGEPRKAADARTRPLADGAGQAAEALALWLLACDERLAELASGGSLPGIVSTAGLGPPVLQTRAIRDDRWDAYGPVTTYTLLGRLPPWLESAVPARDLVDGFVALCESGTVPPAWVGWATISDTHARVLAIVRAKEEAERINREEAVRAQRQRDALDEAQRRRDRPDLVINQLERRIEQLEKERAGQ
jgi:hypothetical protein